MSTINDIELPAFPWVWHPQGDANEYCLLTSDNRWVVAFRCNGELMTAKQEAIIRHMVAAANAAEGVSITALETVGKSLFDGDIATLEQESRQMRARMERLERENAELLALVKEAAEPSATQERADVGLCAQWDVDALKLVARAEGKTKSGDKMLRKYVADAIRGFVDEIQFVYVTTAADMYRLADQYEKGGAA